MLSGTIQIQDECSLQLGIRLKLIGWHSLRAIVFFNFMSQTEDSRFNFINVQQIPFWEFHLISLLMPYSWR